MTSPSRIPWENAAVRSYFEQRLRAAGQALQAVTGEEPEEPVAILGGQLEGEIDSHDIYKRARWTGR